MLWADKDLLEVFGIECAQYPLVGSEEIQIREPVLSLTLASQ